MIPYARSGDLRNLAWRIVAAIHLLSSSAWFGAMLYSLLAIHPRARRFFGKDDAKFEELIATIAQGARWKVLSLLAMIGLSGAAMIPLSHLQMPAGQWNILIAVKAVLLLVAVGIFAFVSWRMWPARVLALPSEWEAIRGRFRRIGMILIAIAGLAMVLGIWAHGP